MTFHCIINPLIHPKSDFCSYNKTRGVPSGDHRISRCLVTPGNIYQYNRLLMYFNIVKFGINVLVTILLAPLSLF